MAMEVPTAEDVRNNLRLIVPNQPPVVRPDLSARPTVQGVTFVPYIQNSNMFSVWAEPHWQGYRVFISLVDVPTYLPVQDAYVKKRIQAYVSDPAGTLPLFPVEVSQGVLRAQEDVPIAAITAEYDINTEFEVVNSRVYHSQLLLRKRFAYSSLQFLLSNESLDVPIPLREMVRWISQFASYLQAERKRSNEIDLLFDSKGRMHPRDSRSMEFETAQFIHTELVLLLNATLAEYLADENQQAIYRAQKLSRSASEDEAVFTEISRVLGVPVSDWNQLTPEQVRIVKYLLQRLLKRARYVMHPAPHFSLQVDAYAPFASPSRRLADYLNLHIIGSRIAKTGIGFNHSLLKKTVDFLNGIRHVPQVHGSAASPVVPTAETARTILLRKVQLEDTDIDAKMVQDYLSILADSEEMTQSDKQSLLYLIEKKLLTGSCLYKLIFECTKHVQLLPELKELLIKWLAGNIDLTENVWQQLKENNRCDELAYEEQESIIERIRVNTVKASAIFDDTYVQSPPLDSPRLSVAQDLAKTYLLTTIIELTLSGKPISTYQKERSFIPTNTYYGRMRLLQRATGWTESTLSFNQGIATYMQVIGEDTFEVEAKGETKAKAQERSAYEMLCFLEDTYPDFCLPLPPEMAKLELDEVLQLVKSEAEKGGFKLPLYCFDWEGNTRSVRCETERGDYLLTETARSSSSNKAQLKVALQMLSRLRRPHPMMLEL